MRIVGETITMGGKQNIVEIDCWTWELGAPKQVTMRVVPSDYGDMPHRFLIVDGKPDYNAKVPDRYFETKEQLVSASIERLEKELASLKANQTVTKRQIRQLKGML